MSSPLKGGAAGERVHPLAVAGGFAVIDGDRGGERGGAGDGGEGRLSLMRAATWATRSEKAG